MCGIFGLARADDPLSVTEENIFSQLMLMSSMRGADATGMVNVPVATDKFMRRIRDGKQHFNTAIRKDATPSWWFLEERANKDFIRQGNKTAMLGHTRAATVGERTIANAHPFDFDNVVGMANGTMGRHNIPGGFTYETDTEGIYALINEAGPEEALSILTAAERSPMALCYINKKLNTLELFRNTDKNKDTRPLVVAISEDNGTLLWASEPGFLYAATSRVGYNLSEKFRYSWLQAGKLYRYPLSAPTTKWLDQVKIIPIVAKTRPFVWEYTAPPHRTSMIPATGQETRNGYVGGFRGFGPGENQEGDKPTHLVAGTPSIPSTPSTALSTLVRVVSWDAFVPNGASKVRGTVAEPPRLLNDDSALDIPGWLVRREDGTSIANDDKPVATQDCVVDDRARQMQTLYEIRRKHLEEQEANAKANATAQAIAQAMQEAHGVTTEKLPNGNLLLKASPKSRVTPKAIVRVGHDYVPADENGHPLVRRGPNGNPIGHTLFTAYLAHDCCNCGNPMDAQEKGIDYKIGWTSSDGGFLPICEDCMDAPDSLVQNYFIEDDARKDHEGGLQ